MIPTKSGWFRLLCFNLLPRRTASTCSGVLFLGGIDNPRTYLSNILMSSSLMGSTGLPLCRTGGGGGGGDGFRGGEYSFNNACWTRSASSRISFFGGGGGASSICNIDAIGGGGGGASGNINGCVTLCWVSACRMLSKIFLGIEGNCGILLNGGSC